MLLSDLDQNHEELEKLVNTAKAQILAKEPILRSGHQNLFLRLIVQYGTTDVGVLF